MNGRVTLLSRSSVLRYRAQVARVRRYSVVANECCRAGMKVGRLEWLATGCERLGGLGW